jgi:uncharacterized membrane protein YqiK
VYFKGEAEAILAKAKAKSNALTMLAEAITTEVSKDKIAQLFLGSPIGVFQCFSLSDHVNQQLKQ